MLKENVATSCNALFTFYCNVYDNYNCILKTYAGSCTFLFCECMLCLQIRLMYCIYYLILTKYSTVIIEVYINNLLIMSIYASLCYGEISRQRLISHNIIKRKCSCIRSHKTIIMSWYSDSVSLSQFL